MTTLRRIHLMGYKSIASLDLELRPLNVLVGANGSGKSNFVSFFELLYEVSKGRLPQYVAKAGGAHTLLHFGTKVTEKIEAGLEFVHQGHALRYELQARATGGDGLVVSESLFEGAGGQDVARTVEGCRKTVDGNGCLAMLSCRVYHFHDTTPTAGVRLTSYVGDSQWLHPSGENLAAVLHRWREEHRPQYDRIVATIRLVAPFFDDFVLEPTASGRDVMLDWRARGSDHVFGPHQLSDGTVRAMCLISLLLQPQLESPGLVIVDEPELGLHPYALRVVADLFRRASVHCQVIVGTQSSAFLDEFDPADVIVADHGNGESLFRRLTEVELAQWLEEYSLGEVWEKNVFGGGPV